MFSCGVLERAFLRISGAFIGAVAGGCDSGAAELQGFELATGGFQAVWFMMGSELMFEKEHDRRWKEGIGIFLSAIES